MKKKNILTGLILIVLAVLLVGNGLDLLPSIPWFKIIGTTLFGAYAIKRLWKREFFSAMLALGCVAWIWEDSIIIGATSIAGITPFPLLVAAGLVGAGLNMIIGKKPKIITIRRDGGETVCEACTFEEAAEKVGHEEWQDGRHVSLTNIFNTTSKYVNSEAFSTASFENAFGSANVYFDNAIIAGGRADVEIENAFGQMNLYFPSTWRLQLDDDATFGSVKVYGGSSLEPDAPLVVMKAETAFGNINIYFQ